MSHRPPIEGYRSPGDSSDRLARSRSEHSGIGAGAVGKWQRESRRGNSKKEREREREMGQNASKTVKHPQSLLMVHMYLC